MEIGTVISILFSVVLVAFNVGYVYKSFKDRPTRDQVYQITEKEISKHHENCRYYPEVDGVKNNTCLENLEKTVDGIDKKVDVLITNMK